MHTNIAGFHRTEQQRRNVADTLDRRSQAIDRRSIELNEREAEISRRSMELDRRERDLDARERELNAEAITATVRENIADGGRRLLGQQTNGTRTPAQAQSLADQIVRSGAIRRGEIEAAEPALPTDPLARAIVEAGMIRRGELLETSVRPSKKPGSQKSQLSLADQIILAGKIRRGEVEA
jgi:hypothetical protein